MNPILSFVLPCYQRPERTRRMINCIRNQGLSNWEGFIFGDYCNDFDTLLQSEWYKQFLLEMKEKGNIVHTGNMETHGGGHGFEIINKAIKEATGEYFLFLSNDDTILPHHFEHYVTGIQQLSRIHGYAYDFVFYNTLVPPNNNGTRIANLSYGGCGHAELIIRTSFLKEMPPHGSNYGHDWVLIQNMMRLQGRYRHALSQECTYEVRSIPGKTIDTIN